MSSEQKIGADSRDNVELKAVPYIKDPVSSPREIIDSVQEQPALTPAEKDAAVEAAMAQELARLEQIKAEKSVAASSKESDQATEKNIIMENFGGVNPLEIKAQEEFQSVSSREVKRALAAAEALLEETNQEVETRAQWMREKIERAGNWYKRQPLKYKLLASVGFVGAASASAAIGGVLGTAIATAALTGTLTQRTLGGMATFIAAEGWLKQAAEKGGQERTEGEAKRHTIEAAVLGLLVGSGAVAGAARSVGEATGLKNIFADAYKYWLPQEEANAMLAGVGKTLPAMEGHPAAIPGNYIETAQAGDSVWKLARHQLEAHFGQQFTDMTEAQKNYLIDTIKDRVAENPEKFGLTNIDQVAIGQKIDFSGAFQDKNIITRAFARADTLVGGDAATPEAPLQTAAPAVSAHGLGGVEASLSGGEATTPLTPEAASANLTNEIAAGNFEHVSPEIIEQTHAVIDHDINEIYSWKFLFFSGSQMEEWEVIKGQDASAILEAKNPIDAAFGAPVGILDSGELTHRQEIQDYLKNLVLHSGLTPTGGEKVEEFIKKAIVRSLLESK